MKNLLVCLIVGLSMPAYALNINDCQYLNSRELKAVGTKNVADFRSTNVAVIKTLAVQSSKSPTAFENSRKANTEFKNEYEIIKKFYPWAPILFKVHQEILKHPALKIFVDNGLLQLSFGELPNCGLACTGIAFGVNIAPELLDKVNKKSPERFETNVRFLLSHEIGHYIYSINLWRQVGFKSYAEFETAYGKMNYTKIHLAVDSIGTALAGISLVDAAIALNEMFKDEETASIGDIPLRVKCLIQ